MGQKTEGSITTFWPDDTETSLYLEGDVTGIDFSEIWKAAREKWPGIKMEEITITPEHIHTNCIYFDAYDGADWTNFLHIECSTEYLERMTAPEKT